MLSGSAELSGFDVSQLINGGFYSGYFAVPEPASGTLFPEAVGCLVFFRMCKSRVMRSDAIDKNMTRTILKAP